MALYSFQPAQRAIYGPSKLDRPLAFILPRSGPPTPVRTLAPVRASALVPTPYKSSVAPVVHGEVIRPPRSMIADGGTPPRRYAKDASVAEATALIRAYAAEQKRASTPRRRGG